MRTTIDLPDPVFREVKTRAIQQGTTLKELVTHYIQAGLRSHSVPPASNPSRRPPPPVAIRREPGLPLTAALGNRDLAALLAQDDLAHCQRVFTPPSAVQ